MEPCTAQDLERAGATLIAQGKTQVQSLAGPRPRPLQDPAASAHAPRLFTVACPSISHLARRAWRWEAGGSRAARITSSMRASCCCCPRGWATRTRATTRFPSACPARWAA